MNPETRDQSPAAASRATSAPVDGAVAQTGPNAVPDWGWPHGDMPTGMPVLLPIIQKLMPDLPPGARSIDLGCGNGFLAGWLAERGCAVIGVDCSASGIEHARKALPNVRFEPLSIHAGLLEELGEAPFDLAVSTEVVEHLYAPREWASAAFNCLQPGGWFVCSTPYHGYFKNLGLGVAGAWDRHFNVHREGGHIKFFSRKTLTTLLHEAGFTEFTYKGAGRAPLVWKSLVVRCRKPG